MKQSYKLLSEKIIDLILASREIGLDIDNRDIEELITKDKVYARFAGDIKAMQGEDIDLTDVRYYNIENMLRVMDKFTQENEDELELFPLFYHPEEDVYLGLPIDMIDKDTLIDILCETDDLSGIEKMSKAALSAIGLEEDVTVTFQRPSHHHVIDELFGTSQLLDYEGSVPYRYFLNLIGFIDVIPGVQNYEKRKLVLTPVMSETMNEDVYERFEHIELYANVSEDIWAKIFEECYELD